MTKHSLIGIYAILACFASFIVGIVFLGISLFDLLEISFPEQMLNVYRSDLREDLDLTEADYQRVYINIENPPSFEEALRKGQEERVIAYKMSLDLEVKSQKLSLVRSIIYLLISIVAFIIHWKLAKRIDNKMGV